MARSLERALRGVVRPTVDAESVDSAKAVRADHRARQGFKATATPLLTDPDGNYKLNKSVVPTYGLALAQADLSGFEVCPRRTAVCTAGCVAGAGKGSLDSVQRARVARTTMLAEDPQAFLVLLEHEIRRAVVKHGAINLRLNTFSDLRWEIVAPWLFDIAGVTFYDYTKWAPHQRETPANYSLTFSASERMSDAEAAEIVLGGDTVAMVFDTTRTSALPATWAGVPVVDGDKSDDRTLDHGVIVGLRAKGTMRTLPANGMVRRVA